MSMTHLTSRRVRCLRSRARQPAEEVRPEAMLCWARRISSSAYSASPMTGPHLRPREERVPGAESPSIRRHESAYVEREEVVVLPSDECSRPRGASPRKTKGRAVPST